jgi:hypothetical protein
MDREQLRRANFVQWLVSHPRYEALTGLAIFCNACVMIWECESKARDIQSDEWNGRRLSFRLLGYTFCVIFLADLAARLFAYRRAFFCGARRDWQWNIFDAVCVLGLLFEMMVDSIAWASSADGRANLFNPSGLLRTVRLVRVVRVFQILRVVSVFRDLRLMVTSLCACLLPLLWFLIVLSVVLIGFGIVLTDAASDFLISSEKETKSVASVQKLSAYFGSLYETTKILFQAISGGRDWSEPLTPVEVCLPSYVGFLYYGFVAFTLFAMLNIGNAIFVDTVAQRSRNDREYVVESAVSEKEDFLALMDAVFNDIDQEGDGRVSLHDLQWHLAHQPEVCQLLEALKINVHEISKLFSLMDVDLSGYVDRAEFRQGCESLRGGARQLDLAIMHQEVKRASARLRDIALLLNAKNGGRLLGD